LYLETSHNPDSTDRRVSRKPRVCALNKIEFGTEIRNGEVIKYGNAINK
jgi:hypothetical protein